MTGSRDAAVTAALETAESLHAQLNPPEKDSSISHLNRDGEAVSRHVARIVVGGFEYDDPTVSVFDIYQARVQQKAKTFLGGVSEIPPTEFGTGTVGVSGTHVTTDVELDLSGLAEKVTNRLR